MATGYTNAEPCNIPKGRAVSVTSRFARLAGPDIAATGIASEGAISRGTVVVIQSGTLEMGDWTQATGSKKLIPGASYSVSNAGALVPSKSGDGLQVAGIAQDSRTLSVMIGSPVAPVESTYEVVAEPYVPPPFVEAHILVGSRVPLMPMGNVGDYYLQMPDRLIWGPKTVYGWGGPEPLVS